MIKKDYQNLNPTEIISILTATSNHIVLIENFPDDNDQLRTLVQSIGSSIPDTKNIDSDCIFEVKVHKKNGMFNSYANSNFYFPLHTDCSDYEVIPNGLALFCSQSSTKGGESYFSDVDDVLLRLTEDDRMMLMSKIWSFRNRKGTIIFEKDDRFSIRYNRITLESYSKLCPEEQSFLDYFDTQIRDSMFQIKLKNNDLILVRNDKFLHGRNEFEITSKRLIKRIRFNI